ncbi:MAG: nuclear transport factor 2 family protein [Candidatus Aminicenantes bacterium]|nr:nuclear transport factor 2 family protein [Candidatus Aminicenantes bacterium]
MRRKAALFGVLLCAFFARHSFVFAQQSGSIADRAYKNDVLQKIAGLVESKYVLADKAKGYADEFRVKCASGSYDALTEAKEFAEKVTLVTERVLLGPRGGGPPPGDGFESAPVKEICDAIVGELDKKAASPTRPSAAGGDELGRIEQAIRDCIGWAKTKDFRLLYGVIANDPDFLEVHPDGAVVKGFEDFKKAEKFWGSPDFKAVRYEIRDLKIKLSRSGDVAWFYCILDDINEWKGQPASWENTRWTGVLEKRDGRWVMAQQHFSFAAKD